MKGPKLLSFACFVAVATGALAAAAPEGTPLYTSEDLERMFGPPPKSPSERVDKSRPEDWRFVEQFLARQYSRIDADRTHDLDRRAVDVAENRVAPASPYRYGGVAWGLGYPANIWWQKVWSSYSGCNADDRQRHGRHSGRRR